MKIRKVFEELSPKFSKIDDLGDLPDNRDEAEVGDLCAAKWFDDPEWYLFTIESLKYAHPDQTEDETLMGIGLDDGDTVYDIGMAYHVIVLK